MTTSQNILKEKQFEQKTFKTKNGIVLPYCSKLTCPDKKGKAAVFFFLHGAGERGTDNHTQLTHGGYQVVEYLEAHQIKCLVVFPQCAEEMKWVDTPWDALSHVMPKKPSVMMSAAISLLKKILSSPEIDLKRVYVSGLSMGGYGTWDILSRFPELFAGAVICCGGGDVNQAVKIKDVPIQFYHGAVDSVVPVVRSRDMAKALKAAGAKRAYYHEIRKTDHDCWTAAFGDSYTWQWLFDQRKKQPRF